MSETYSVGEFAELMKVNYNTVRYWANQGYIKGAFQQGDGVTTIKRWRIPKEALGMERPRRGRASQGGIIKNKVEAGLRAELADLNQRHNDHMLEYAGLLGRCELAEKQRDDFRRLYEDVLAQMNHKNEELKALAEEVRSLNEELSSWHEKMKSISTQSTG